MKIVDDYDNFCINGLQLKKPKSFKNGFFLEIRYKKHPLYILTPKMLTPFGLNQFGTGLSISFTDEDFDPKIESFKNLIKRIDDFLQRNDIRDLSIINNRGLSLNPASNYSIINSNSSNSNSNSSLEESSNSLYESDPDILKQSTESSLGLLNSEIELVYKPSIKKQDNNFPALMTLKTVKTRDYETIAYNEEKEEIKIEEIKEKSLIIFIIHLAGIWVTRSRDILEADDKFIYGPQWNIVQMRIDPPIELKPFAILEDYSSAVKSLTENRNQLPLLSQSAVLKGKASPPPIPPPPPPASFFKNNRKSILQIIRERRGIMGSENSSLKSESLDKELLKVPTIYEIRKGLKNLKSVKKDPNERIYTSNNVMDIMLGELRDKLADKRKQLQFSLVESMDSNSGSIYK